jgi:hypothetical protein
MYPTSTTYCPTIKNKTLTLAPSEASTGSLLFSGIDTAKYSGSLTRLSLYPTADNVSNSVTEFAVALTSVTAVSPSGTDRLGSANFPAIAILDSGTTMTLLPDDLVDTIWALASATPDSKGLPSAPCSFASGAGYLSFGFGGPNSGAVVNVSIAELILPGALGTYNSGPFKGGDVCEFGIMKVPSTGNPTYVLGDTFLRSAYVVYDLMNLEAALAQTDFNATGSNVVPFPSMNATVPSATPAPSQADIASGVVTTVPTSLSASASFGAQSTATSGSGSGSKNAGSAVRGGLTGLMWTVALAVGFMGAGFAIL